MLSSDYDLKTAEHMFKSRRYVYVIFMCHMSIEKLLKAIVTENISKSSPKTHNLLYLIKKTDINIPQDLFDFIARINNTSIATRYPENFKSLVASYPRNIAKSYLKKTKEALKWLRQNEKLIQ